MRISSRLKVNATGLGRALASVGLYVFLVALGALMGAAGYRRCQARQARIAHHGRVRAPRADSPKNDYRKYLEQVFRTLRQEKAVVLVRVTLPREVLSYERRPASLDPTEFPALHARTARVPMMAVSKNAERFLANMRVHEIDPKTVPPILLQGAPMNVTTMQKFVLVPDVTGKNAEVFNMKSE